MMNVQKCFWFALCLFHLDSNAHPSNVFEFASHQNSCCHQSQFANNNPCCLLHQASKSIGCTLQQNYALNPQLQLQVNAVNSQVKLGFGLNFLHIEFNQFKQTQLSFNMAFNSASKCQFGFQIKGLQNVWLNHSAYLSQINLANKWQLNKRTCSIGLIEQVNVLSNALSHFRTLPKVSWAIQYELQKDISIQINVSNSALGKLKLGGHLLINQLNRQWLIGLSDNLQECGLALNNKLNKKVHWGLGLLYHWQLGLSNCIQLNYAF